MKVNLYVIRDKVAESSSMPFSAVNDGIAKRQYNNLVKDVVSPDDFELWQVGTYDDTSDSLYGYEGGNRQVMA